MFHRISRLLIACAFAVLSAVALVVPAQAAVNCDNIVTDDARVFKSTNDIERAAEEASRRVGADVHVVTTNTFAPVASLDEFYQQTLKKCAAWQGRSADGSVVPKSNLLVLLMSVEERKVAIMYGDDWKPALKERGQALRIQSEEMGPFFRDGDFAGGFVKGIESSQQAIVDFQNPAPEPPPAPVTNIDNSEPMDLSGLWTALILIAVFAFVIIGGYIGIRLYREYMAQRQERETAKQEALAERDAASAILAKVGDPTRQDVRTAQVKKYSAVDDDTKDRLIRLAKDVDVYYGEAVSGMTAARDAYGDYIENGLTAAQYSAMATRYSTVHNAAKQASEADQQIIAICEEANERLKTLTASTQSLQTRLSAHLENVQMLHSKGYRFDHGDVDRAQALLDSAQEKGATLEALQDVNNASSEVDALEAAYASHVQLLQQQAESREELRARLVGARTRHAEAVASFGRISAAYARTSWESVQGNGTEATNRLDEAVLSLDAADKAAEMSEQRWDDVLISTQQGNLLVDEAESLLGSIISREANLLKAQATAQQEIDLAQADIDQADRYVDEFDADIRDSHENDIVEAREMLMRARDELAKQQPDYLVVLDAALAANRMADTVFAEAQNEHEAAERLRHQAAAAVERAQITIDKTGQFIDDHSSDVGSSAPKKLKSAVETLQNSIDADDTSSKLSLAEEALKQAQSAYSKAKSDFDQAEAAREAERQRRRREREEREDRERRSRDTVIVGGWGSSSSSSSSSSGFDSFGGGSSSGFGGFDGGGGGSSSGW